MENYITIPEAFNSLGLSPIEKLALALINGYSQGGQGAFYGTVTYIQGWLGCSRPTAVGTMRKLVEKGMIIKSECRIDDQNRVTYRINPEWLQTLPEGGKEFLPGWLKNFTGGGKEFLPEWLKNLTEGGKKTLLDTLLKENNKKKEKYKEKDGEDKSSSISPKFVVPTFEEVDAYVKEKGYHFSSIEFYAYYANNDWRLSNGRRMKDWRYACVTFECKQQQWNSKK